MLPMKDMKATKAMKDKKAMNATEKTETVWRCTRKTWPTEGHHGEWMADIQWNRAMKKVVETWMVPVRIPLRRPARRRPWWTDPKAAKKATKAMTVMKATGAKLPKGCPRQPKRQRKL